MTNGRYRENHWRRERESGTAQGRARRRRAVRHLSVLHLGPRHVVQTGVEHLFHAPRRQRVHQGLALLADLVSAGLVGNPLGTDLDHLDDRHQPAWRPRCDERGRPIDGYAGRWCNEEMKDRLHRAAGAAAVVGAVGSVALTLYAGRNNNLPFLMILMSGWVLAPFMGYALASRYTSSWSASTRSVLDGIIVFVAVTSLVVYARDVLKPPASKAAAVFVAVPIGAWLLMPIAVPLTGLISRRRSRSVPTP